MKHVIVKEVDGTVHSLEHKQGMTGLDVRKIMAEKYNTEIDNIRLIFSFRGSGSVLTEQDENLRLKMNPDEYIICNVLVPRQKGDPQMCNAGGGSGIIVSKELQKKIKMLVDMGFDRDAAEKALQKASTVEAAANLLIPN